MKHQYKGFSMLMLKINERKEKNLYENHRFELIKMIIIK